MLNHSSFTLPGYFKFLGKRLLYVVLPYAAWVFIYYVYFCCANYFPFNLSDLPGYLVRGDLVSHFYFVVIIVQFYLLAPLFAWLAKKISAAWLLIFSLLFMIILGGNLPDIIRLFAPGSNFPYADRVFTTYLFYWVAGCCAAQRYQEFKKALTANKVFITAVFLLAAAANAYLSWLNMTGLRPVYWLESVHLLYCVSAVAFFYMLACYLFRRRLKLDGVSYAIYLSHVLVIFITDSYLPLLIPGAPPWLMYLARLCVVYGVTLGGALVWHKIKAIFKTRVAKEKKI